MDRQIVLVMTLKISKWYTNMKSARLIFVGRRVTKGGEKKAESMPTIFEDDIEIHWNDKWIETKSFHTIMRRVAVSRDGRGLEHELLRC